MSTPGGADEAPGAVRRGASGGGGVPADPALREPAVAEAARRRRHFSPWNVLLVVPFIGVLFPGWYNKASPHLFGLPFFYWWQFAWIAIAVVMLVIVYLATRGAR
jgi:hypothetical protein